jgi:ABC-type molybdate transport system substrate-binding protein
LIGYDRDPVHQQEAGAMTKTLNALVAVIVGSMTATSIAAAAEIKIFTSRAIATVLEKVGSEFERVSGNRLNVVVGFSPVFVKQIDWRPVRCYR